MEANKIDNYLKELLILMSQKKASDLHLSVGSPPYIRIDGDLSPLSFPPLEEEECKKMLHSIMSRVQLEKFRSRKVVDFSFADEEVGRFRANIYRQRSTIAAAVRAVSETVPSMEDLGLPVEIVKAFCDRQNGLVLVSGPTGSGKTTSLAAMIDYINRSRRCHIITIEDPIEYIHKNVSSLVHQRELDVDTLSFADALKYGLREDPDVVLIGEMRDVETIDSAISMAETGHLILSSLHTGETSESLQRMINVFPPQYQQQIAIQLSSGLIGEINQKLLPMKDSPGRTIATEILVATDAIKNIIRENKTESVYSHIQIGNQYGMKTMNQSLCDLVGEGKITKETAVSRTSRIKELTKMLEKY